MSYGKTSGQNIAQLVWNCNLSLGVLLLKNRAIEKLYVCGMMLLYWFPPIAQPVEQLPFKEKVPGSIPGGRIRKKLSTHLWIACGKLHDTIDSGLTRIHFKATHSLFSGFLLA